MNQDDLFGSGDPIDTDAAFEQERTTDSPDTVSSEMAQILASLKIEPHQPADPVLAPPASKTSKRRPYASVRSVRGKTGTFTVTFSAEGFALEERFSTEVAVRPLATLVAEAIDAAISMHEIELKILDEAAREATRRLREERRVALGYN